MSSGKRNWRQRHNPFQNLLGREPSVVYRGLLQHTIAIAVNNFRVDNFTSIQMYKTAFFRTKVQKVCCLFNYTFMISIRINDQTDVVLLLFSHNRTSESTPAHCTHSNICKPWKCLYLQTYNMLCCCAHEANYHHWFSSRMFVSFSGFTLSFTLHSYAASSFKNCIFNKITYVKMSKV